MLQNKIYLNYYIEIFKTFFIIVFGLSLIALTVRAVNFLELIVDSGYPVITYFQYSFLNLFGIAPKFIPLAFLVSITYFIIKHYNDGEFIILWSSGVKKIQLVNLLLLSSLGVFVFYIILSAFLTPFALNKSRNLLNQDSLNNFLPTIKIQQFSDSFKGFTFIVDNKIDNEIKNIFLHDTGNNLKKFSSNTSNVLSTSIVAEKGIIEDRIVFLINGQIISSKKDKIEVINFEQMNINLGDLSTSTIKKPKLQETSTFIMLSCFIKNINKFEICNLETEKEIIPNLIRRLILPLYIPVLALLCSFLFVKNSLFFKDKILIYASSFFLLVSTELFIRYTGLYNQIKFIYIFFPFLLFLLLYSSLIFKLKKKINRHE